MTHLPISRSRTILHFFRRTVFLLAGALLPALAFVPAAPGGARGTVTVETMDLSAGASFTCSTDKPKAGQTVTFTDTSTGSPTSWSWSFGDGGTSTAQNPTHVYTSGGTFTVTLTAGGTTASRNLTVSSTPEFTITQCITDQAQRTTIAFSGLAMMTGNLEAQSFFPPGKVADYTGFQYLRDNDPDSMGHNTSFLTKVAFNVIYILNDSQFEQLKALAVAQIASINQYGYKRFPLMKAFRRLLAGDIPAGSSGLNLEAVKAASRELYLLDGQISFDRAELYATILKSMDSTQTAWLADMKGKGWISWPEITDDMVRERMRGLSQETGVAVMTYAGDLFSWYAGSVEADTYFCPERHGTYYGGFYIKDAPAIGHEGYSINEQLTATAGAALCDSSKGYVTAAQASVMSSLVDTQRDNLYASSSASIVGIRTQIAALLRGLLDTNAAKDDIEAQVLALSGVYGELDGENNYNYINIFKQVYDTLSDSQKTQLSALRKEIMSGTYSDGTPFDFSVCTTPYLYSNPITDLTLLSPYIDNTDYLFATPAAPVASFTFLPAAPTAGQTVTFTDTSTGSPASWSWNFGDGGTSSSQNPTHAFAAEGVYTVTLTAANDLGSSTATGTVTVSGSQGGTFTLASDVGEDGGRLPTEYTCDGAGASPALAWANPPAGVAQYAVTMTTLAPDGATKYNWVLYGIPASATGLAKNTAGVGTLGVTTNGVRAYAAPCSQGPGDKLYTFTVYALSGAPSLPSSPEQVSGEVLSAAIAPLALGSASLDLSYARLSPTAAFTFAPIAPAVGQTVTFTDASTGSSPASWSWNFGDGSTSIQQNPTHAYALSGTFTVTLTVANGIGSSSVSHTVTVSTTVTSPVAAFVFSPETPSVGDPVSFTDTSTETPTSWSWTFGDGGASTSQNPTHAFAAAGSYPVTLTATNASGSSSATRTVVVTASSADLSYPVVDTGQKRCYNASAEIPAPSPGQSFYGQDGQHAGNQPSYTLSTDGQTVQDNVTGLTWMRGPNTIFSDPVAADKMTPAQAEAWVATVNAQNYGGYSDWRIPAIKELYSLMSFDGTDPSGYTGTDTSVLTPFIDTRFFLFGYGQPSAGERIIDSQYLSCDVFVVNPAETGAPKVFGLNLADGRIKGYDLIMPGGSEKTFFVQLVRGGTQYGINNFADNGDGTVTDRATGLMWSQEDSGTGLTWESALAWVQARNAESFLGYGDWRLPDAKELHTLVNYANAPDYNGLPAIDTAFFACTAITNENGDADFPYYWTSTTHAAYTSGGTAGTQAVYLPFGRALGWPEAGWVDVHGAGCQRSDPKVGPPYPFATTRTVSRNGTTYTGYSFGPQGDAVRGNNYVRLVRTAAGGPVAGDLDGDGMVGAADLLILRAYLSDESVPGPGAGNRADVNGDGRVDILDLMALQRLVKP